MGQAQSKSESLIGKKVPDLAFGPIVNYTKQNAKLSDYPGKLVILDFWATWCPGCIEAFPHLEALKEKFSEEIEILAISSSDSKERIEKFLSKKKTTLPIVLDTALVLKMQFPHRVLSHTVLIDADRITRAITTPEHITEEVIQNILDGKSVELKEKRYDSSWSKEDHLASEDAIFQFTLTPFNGGTQTLKPFKDGRLLINGFFLRAIYEYAYGFPYYTRTVFEVENQDTYKAYQYSLEVIAPDMTESQVLAIMRDYLHRALPLQSKVEKRKVPVKVLKRIPGQLKVKQADPDSKPEFSFSGRGMHMQNNPIDGRLTRFLENRLARKDEVTVVIDETGLLANYDIDIPWYPENPENIHKELAKLGLELIDAERKVDLLILYKTLGDAKIN